MIWIGLKTHTVQYKERGCLSHEYEVVKDLDNATGDKSCSLPPNKEQYFSSGKYREKIWGTPDIQNAQTPQRKAKKSFAYLKKFQLDLQFHDLFGLQDCSALGWLVWYTVCLGLWCFWRNLAHWAWGAPGGLMSRQGILLLKCSPLRGERNWALSDLNFIAR